MEFSLRDDLKGGNTVKFNTPIKASTKMLIGYPGQYLNQDNIVHYEIFTDNIDFMVPGKDKKNKDEEYYIYKIPRYKDFFYAKSDIAKLVPLTFEIGGRALFKRVKSSADEKNIPTVNSFKVELIAGPAEEVWINRKETAEYFTYKRDGDGYEVNKDGTIKAYKSCPQIKKEVSYPEGEEKINLKKSDKLVYYGYSKEKKFYPDTTPTNIDKKHGDYRKIKVGDKTGWFLRDTHSRDLLAFDANYRIFVKAEGEITLYPDCPQMVVEELERPESFEYQVFAGDFIKRIESSLKTFPDTSPAFSYQTEGDYRKFSLNPALPDKQKGKKGYISEDAFPVSWHDDSKQLCEIDKTFDKWYDNDPELYQFSELKLPGEEDRFKLPEELVIDGWKEEAFDSEGDKYLQIKLDDKLKGWVKADDFKDPANVTKLNYYNWADFDFKKIEDKNEDGVYDFRDILEDEHEFNRRLDDKYGKHNQEDIRRREHEYYLRKLVCKHPTEWKEKDDAFYEILKNKPYKLNPDKIEELKAHISDLVFWDEIADLPAPNGLYYFHPLDFIEHLEKVTIVDYIFVFLNNMAERAGLKIVNYKGASINFYAKAYNALENLLKERSDEIWDGKRDVWDDDEKKYVTKLTLIKSNKTFKENINNLLKVLFDFSIDDDIKTYIGNHYISSTFEKEILTQDMQMLLLLI